MIGPNCSSWKIFISFDNLFSIKDIEIRDIVLENANFDLDTKNYNFFIELLNKGFQILFFGAPGKEEERITKLCENKANRHVISSHYSLEEQMAIMSNLDVMISMDSSFT